MLSVGLTMILMVFATAAPAADELGSADDLFSGLGGRSGKLTFGSSLGLSSATAEEEKSTSGFREEDYVVTWTAQLVSPGRADAVTESTAQVHALRFMASPDMTFHVYKAAVTDDELSTIFTVTEKGGFQIGAPVTDRPIISTDLGTGLISKYHKGNVGWELPLTVAASTRPGVHQIKGMIGYQACTDKSCLRPKGLQFVANVQLADDGTTLKLAKPIELTVAKFAVVADTAAETNWVDGVEEESSESPVAAPEETEGSVPADAPAKSTSLPIILSLAFVGGVILNFMPCVLPVVGLKVMSFVSQAGENRSRVLALNLVYAAGILFVFGILALLAVGLSFSWGQQFTYFSVKLTLVLVLFALALSYLGVWEIPMPGMAAGKASQELQNREGYLGAFSKGVFATVLATPCSGPLLGGIFGLTIALSPVATVAVFVFVGLGMAVPYLLIGLNPSLVSWLPKPGPWMETLKQFLAFLLLATVAYFFAGFRDEHRVPVFVTLIGVWFGCWIIGQVPNWAMLQKRLLAWGGGIVAATLIGIAAFNFSTPEEVKWEPYSEARLQQLHAEGRTVMLDFTASWCFNCQVNTRFAIDTEETKEMLLELNAVGMLADFSDYDDSIKQKLEELESRSIPLLAIYPGSSPEKPIILRDLVSQGAVLDALQEAGPSQSASNGSVLVSSPVSDH
ncbi:MAG: thioredoxin family protein [Planctomycetota bacterium]